MSSINLPLGSFIDDKGRATGVVLDKFGQVPTQDKGTAVNGTFITKNLGTRFCPYNDNTNPRNWRGLPEPVAAAETGTGNSKEGVAVGDVLRKFIDPVRDLPDCAEMFFNWTYIRSEGATQGSRSDIQLKVLGFDVPNDGLHITDAQIDAYVETLGYYQNVVNITTTSDPNIELELDQIGRVSNDNVWSATTQVIPIVHKYYRVSMASQDAAGTPFVRANIFGAN